MRTFNRMSFASAAMVALVSPVASAPGAYGGRTRHASTLLLGAEQGAEYQRTGILHPRLAGPVQITIATELLSLIRAKRPSSKNNRMYALKQADWNVRYTEGAIKDYPNCSIRDHVMQTRAEVNRLFSMYGAKPMPSAK